MCCVTLERPFSHCSGRLFSQYNLTIVPKILLILVIGTRRNCLLDLSFAYK